MVLAALPGTQKDVHSATGLAIGTVWRAVTLLLADGAIRVTGETLPGVTGKSAQTYCATGLPSKRQEHYVGKNCKKAALTLQNYFGRIVNDNAP